MIKSFKKLSLKHHKAGDLVCYRCIQLILNRLKLFPHLIKQFPFEFHLINLLLLFIIIFVLLTLLFIKFSFVVLIEQAYTSHFIHFGLSIINHVLLLDIT